MKKRASHRKHGRRQSGRPPRWLILGALAASTLHGRLATRAHAHEDEATLPSSFTTAQALPAQRLDLPAQRFEIPAGPLSEVLKAFQETSGVRVQVAQEGIFSLDSPGVSGLMTADKALDEILRGTGVAYLFTSPRTAALDFLVSDIIEVTAPVAPSSPKYTEPLRDTPQTLTVIPERLIEQQGATTLRDVLRNVTGISIQAGEGGGGLPGDNLAIRGFSARNDIFVDGVRDFGAYSRDPFNIEQVEVVKGPASLYAGRGSTGGSLNLATKQPNLAASQGGTIGIGTDEFSRATIDLNQPLANAGGPAGAAFRLNAMWTDAGTPGRDEVESSRWGVAPSLAFGLGTPTRVTLSYTHLDQDNLPDYGIPWVPPTNVPLAEYADQPPPVDFDSFYGLRDRDYEKTVTGIATAEVEHDINPALSLRGLVRHGQSERDSIITAPRFAGNDSTLLNRQLQSRDLTDSILAFQNDLTARFDTLGAEHSVVVGIEIARESSENHARTGPAAPQTDLFDPNPDDPYLGPITRTGARTESTADTQALYASDTLKINERWQLLGGLRWDHFQMDYESRAVDGVVTPFEHTDRVLSWRAGVVHKPLPNGSVYLALGTSFNPASEGNTGLSLSDSTVNLEPEESRGAEIGTKWDLLDNRLNLSAAVFRTEKTNARTPGINPGDPAVVLQGEQRISGLELSASGSLTDRWSAFLGYTYLDSEIVESNNAAEVGKEFGNAPEHSASLWTTYRLRAGFEVGGGVQYVGDRFNNNTGTRTAPSYTLVDAMASYDVNERFTLRLNVNNLADKDYIDRVGGGHFIPGAGRSVALTTSVDFR